jgi:hypothetical protein
MARNRKYFIVGLDESLAAERRMINKDVKEGKIPDFENKIFLFQYIRRSANYYYWQSGSCLVQTGATSFDARDFSDYYEAQAISWPRIVPPVTMMQGS